MQFDVTVPYSKLFARFESILESHGGRPHWAKAHRAGPDQLRKMYPRFDDFLELRKRVDPEGRFLNPYVRRQCALPLSMALIWQFARRKRQGDGAQSLPQARGVRLAVQLHYAQSVA